MINKQNAKFKKYRKDCERHQGYHNPMSNKHCERSLQDNANRTKQSTIQRLWRIIRFFQ